MAKWQKVVVSGSSAVLAGLSVDATITGDISGDAGGNAASATQLANARTIAGVSFDGTANISLNNNTITNGAGYITSGGSISGNAATATQLETARNIGGVSFDGTADINLPGVNTTGDQDTSGNAATATSLASSRNLQVSLSSTSAQGFDGSGNATSIGVSGTLGTAQGGLGFAPTLANNGGKVIKVKSDASGFELADDDASSVTPDSTTTFTNKSIDLSSNTVTGTLAEFNTAVSDATLVDLDDSQTLTNKTIDTANNTLTVAQSDVTGLTTALAAKQATVTGAATTITGDNLTVSRALVSNASGKVAVSDVTSTEIGYLDGVTSAIQTQLDAKATSTALTNGLAAKQDTIDSSNRLNANLIGANGDVSNTEYGFLNGVTSAIQTQLDSKIGSSNNTFTGTTTIDVLVANGDVTLGDATTDQVTINGDLTVKGTASFESTENLLVKDRFITLASGSTGGSAGDGGIIVETSSNNGGEGPAFAWNNTLARWGVAALVQSDASSYSADAFLSAVLPAGTQTSAADIANINTAYNKNGNIYTSNDANGNEIWIYA